MKGQHGIWHKKLQKVTWVTDGDDKVKKGTWVVDGDGGNGKGPFFFASGEIHVIVVGV